MPLQSYLMWTHWGPSLNLFGSPIGFHTWEKRNHLYMGEHGGGLGKGSGVEGA